MTPTRLLSMAKHRTSPLVICLIFAMITLESCHVKSEEAPHPLVRRGDHQKTEKSFHDGVEITEFFNATVSSQTERRTMLYRRGRGYHLSFSQDEDTNGLTIMEPPPVAQPRVRDNSTKEEDTETKEPINDTGSRIDDTGSRIIGGYSAAEGRFPFFVEWSRGCGGTLIDRDLVLTAAHCYDPKQLQNEVWVGSSTKGQARKRTVVEYILHPQYNKAQEAFDFLIMRLNREIRGAIQPVVLNTYPGNYRAPTNGEKMTVVGYGVTNVQEGYQSDTLLAADVNYIANCGARTAYGTGVVMEDIMFCAGVAQGGTDSCQGDSGGPILDSQNRQIGLVSFGRGCADPNYPGVYARVSSVSHWISQMRCNSATNAPADCMEITIEILSDAYPKEQSWTLYDQDNHVIYAVKPGQMTKVGLNQWKHRVRAGNYKLTVFDKVGDGMCCMYGNGVIKVNTGSGVVQTGGIFKSETSLTFNVQANAQNFRQNESNKPPPRTVLLRISVGYDQYPKETSWQLVDDNTGRVIDEAKSGAVRQAGVLTREYRRLISGHYWFVIKDSSFDGVCCNNGNGFVRIDQINENGAVIKNIFYHRGDFGDFEEIDFELI